MKDIDYINLSIKIINDVYMGNTTSYFNYIDDNVLWIGPMEGLVFSGRKEMERLEKLNSSNRYFSINSMQSEIVKTSVNTAEVILFFKVFSSSGNGDLFEHSQRIQLSWALKQKTDKNGSRSRVPQIMVIHISNIPIKDEDTKEIKLNESMFFAPQAFIERKTSNFRIKVTTTQKSSLFVIPETILYAESCDNGQHSALYLSDRKVIITEKISSLAQKYPDVFLQVHESYLVNPIYVLEIKRFQVSLVSGINLPVPERKYTSIKKALTEFFDINDVHFVANDV